MILWFRILGINNPRLYLPPLNLLQQPRLSLSRLQSKKHLSLRPPQRASWALQASSTMDTGVFLLILSAQCSWVWLRWVSPSQCFCGAVA